MDRRGLGEWLQRELARLAQNAGHSWAGWTACWSSEKSLRQWVYLNLASLVAIWLAGLSRAEARPIILVGVLLIIVELINSAIEAVVDLASPQRHPLAGRAKDAGSAAVAVTAGLFGLFWVLALFF